MITNTLDNYTSSNNKTIAFITSNLSSKQNRDIWAGILEISNSEGINCICYAADFLFPESISGNIKVENPIYTFMPDRLIDGIIVYGGSIAQHFNSHDLYLFCRQYEPTPLVNIGIELPEIPSIISNDYSGMYKLTEHLIYIHNFKKIALITGPDNHTEANERYRAYCDALKRNGISVHDELIFRGVFSEDTVSKILNKICEKKLMNMDAIIAADTTIATGIYKELKAQNYSIPDDIAIVGFDDSDSTEILPFSLTLVKQPLFIQGKKSAEILLKKIKGVSVPLKTEIPTEIVIRQSCGCVDDLIKNSQVSICQEIKSLNSFQLQNHTDEINTFLKNFSDKKNCCIPGFLIHEFVDSLIKSISSNSDIPFLNSLQNIVECIDMNCGTVMDAHDFISLLRRWANSYVKNDDLVFVENLLHKGRIFIGQKADKIINNRYHESMNHLLKIGEINYLLNSTLEIEKFRFNLGLIAKKYFSHIGINAFYFSLFTKINNKENKSILNFVFEKGVIANIIQNNKIFGSTDLFPISLSHALYEKNLIVKSICFKRESYGFLIFEIDAANSYICDIFTWQISSALKRIYLNKELISKRKKNQKKAFQNTKAL